MTNVATLQTAADLSASITAQGVSSLVPAGVILAFGGATAPTGWLLCEGALVSRTTYANLYAAILNAHGSGDGTTTFALPDYRGRFIRGRDNAAARDADRALRSAAQAGGNTADAVGSVQSIATANPTGTTNKSTTGISVSGTFASSGHQHYGNYGRGGDTVGRFISFASPSVPAGITHTINTSDEGGQRILGAWASGSVSVDAGFTSTPNGTASPSLGSGDNETRPLNAYVNYIIKI